MKVNSLLKLLLLLLVLLVCASGALGGKKKVYKAPKNVKVINYNQEEYWEPTHNQKGHGWKPKGGWKKGWSNGWSGTDWSSLGGWWI